MEIVKLINGLGETSYAIRVIKEIKTVSLLGKERTKQRGEYLSLKGNSTWISDEYVLNFCSSKDLRVVEQRFKEYYKEQMGKTIVKVIERKCKCK